MIAKLYWEHVSSRKPAYFQLPNNLKWSIAFQRKRLPQKNETTALKCVHSRPTQQYWRRKSTPQAKTVSIACQATYTAFSGRALFLLWWMTSRLPYELSPRERALKVFTNQSLVCKYVCSAVIGSAYSPDNICCLSNTFLSTPVYHIN